ncbi:MAG: 2OG-Fe dioxygenase family protein [Acetobacteraceae bacterium]|nr:2OG-Fe dioxygenase family protein [Acetobacteraceae bacterium]
MSDLVTQIRRDGYAFVDGPAMRAILEANGSLADWDAFAASWGDLGLDTYMADGGRYRKRRFAAYRAGPDGIGRKTHQPHYQSRDYNPLHGDIERWFEPVLPEIGAGPSMQTILQTCRGLFDQLTPGASWHIEVHQFRIEARVEEEGRPTPEGMHRDGVDHVLVLLIHRENIRSGVTTINDLEGHVLGSFTLAQPFDSALVDDRRVMHGVTPVEPVDPERPGFRDVLVVTFRRED